MIYSIWLQTISGVEKGSDQLALLSASLTGPRCPARDLICEAEAHAALAGWAQGLPAVATLIILLAANILGPWRRRSSDRRRVLRRSRELGHAAYQTFSRLNTAVRAIHIVRRGDRPIIEAHVEQLVQATREFTREYIAIEDPLMLYRASTVRVQLDYGVVLARTMLMGWSRITVRKFLLQSTKVDNDIENSAHALGAPAHADPQALMTWKIQIRRWVRPRYDRLPEWIRSRIPRP